jgi:hypothetical protein
MVETPLSPVAAGIDAAASPALATILKNLLAKYGAGLLGERRRLLGLLRDYAPDRAREIRLLMTALDLETPQRLAKATDSEALGLEARTLASDAGLRDDVAQWTAATWAAVFRDPAAAPSAVATATGAAPLAAAVDDDLTWDSPQPAAPIQAAIGAQAQPPARALSPINFDPSKSLRYIGIATIVAAVTSVWIFGRDESPVAPPTTEAPAPSAAPAGAPNGEQPIVASPSPNFKDWPDVPDAGHPDNDPLAWHFRTNFRMPDQRFFIYDVTVQIASGMTTGVGVILALDASLASKGVSAVSKSVPIRVDRSLDQSIHEYRATVNVSGWEKNPSNAPLLCINFNAGKTKQRFEPQYGFFCASLFENGVCSNVAVGCGHFP